MKKFKCIVTKEYEYEIEFDEKVWNEDALKDWSSYFTDVDDLQELAEILAKCKTDYGQGEFIEGFAIPMINGKKPHVFGERSTSIDESVNINVIYENDMDVYSKEVV